MKKILYALMLVLGMSVLSSCSKEGNGGSIIGTWEVISDDGEPLIGEGGVFFQFKEDGTSIYLENAEYNPWLLIQTWRLVGDTLLFYNPKQEYQVKELTKDSMTLVDVEDGGIFVLKRVPDSVIEQYLEQYL